MCLIRSGVGEGVGNWFEDDIRRVVGDGHNTLFWFDNWVGDMPLRFKFPRLFDLAVNKECLVEEMARLGWTIEGMAWVWRRRLLAWEEDSVRECTLLLNNVVLQVTVNDTWRWLLDPVHGYSVREAYRFLTSHGEQMDRSLVNDVWHRYIPEKVSLFVWCLLRNKLPTKDNLLRRRIITANDVVYVVGCGETESATHLFLDCRWIGLSTVYPCQLRDHFKQFSFMAGMPRSSHSVFKVIWFACVWVIWKDRNNHIFKNAGSNPSVLVEKIKLNSLLWLKAK